MEILNVKNLSFSYNTPDGQASVIRDVSFSLDRGDFLLVAGATGSGKSTLLRTLKRELTPEGTLSGDIRFFGTELSELSDRDAAARIGFVSQYPEESIVTDKVWHELSFGLENLGTPRDAIRRKTAEMAAYFGIEDIFDSPTDTLSGGQKQLLSLASVMAMDPDILILDEPTSRLDPIAASDFIATLHRLNRELSLTIIIVEHRLEEILPICSKVLALKSGRTSVFAPVRDALPTLVTDETLRRALPAALRVYGELNDENGNTPPLTIAEGRAYVENNYGNGIRSLTDETAPDTASIAIELRGLRHRYVRDGKDVISDLDLTVYEGECITLFGGNGSGKSTLLKAVAGLVKPYSGSVKIFCKKLRDYKNGTLYDGCISMLPQDVKACFLYETVKDELDSVGFTSESLPIDLSYLYDRHPYDVSGGEMQLVALAKALSTRPRILLLDEPTKGLDAHMKSVFVKIIKKLKADGVTVFAVTHDTELAAEISDRTAMLFRGQITSIGSVRAFFSENSFFTTPVSRMTRGYYDGVVTVDDVVTLCRLNGRRI